MLDVDINPFDPVKRLDLVLVLPHVLLVLLADRLFTVSSTFEDER